jgi:hypothetical protein
MVGSISNKWREERNTVVTPLRRMGGEVERQKAFDSDLGEDSDHT